MKTNKTWRLGLGERIFHAKPQSRKEKFKGLKYENE